MLDNSRDEPAGAGGTGALAQNILYFARALREAGLPVGPGGGARRARRGRGGRLRRRGDFRADAARRLRQEARTHAAVRPGVRDLLEAQGLHRKAHRDDVAAGAARQAEDAKGRGGRDPRRRRAVQAGRRTKPRRRRRSISMRASPCRPRKSCAQGFRADERGGNRARAKALIARLALPQERRPHAPLRRRMRAGRRIDPRRSFRRSLRGGGAMIDLTFRAPVERAAAGGRAVDISGSMSEYTRLFLHFLHALGETRRVTTFLFGTRLTNVTRALQRARSRRGAAALRGRGRRLVGRHAHRRVAEALQSRMVAPRARAGGDRAVVHRRAGARRRRDARGRRWSGCTSPAGG